MVALDNEIGSRRCDGDATGDGTDFLWIWIVIWWDEKHGNEFFFFLVLRWGFKQIGVCSDTKTDAEQPEQKLKQQ